MLTYNPELPESLTREVMVDFLKRQILFAEDVLRVRILVDRIHRLLMEG